MKNGPMAAPPFEIEDLDPAFHLRAILPRLTIRVPMGGSAGPDGDLRMLFRGVRRERAGLARDLESMVREAFYVRHSLLVESGRAAIKLALISFGLRAGDGVILPAYVCASVLQPVLELRLRPILADVGNDLQVDPDSVRRVSRLGAKTLVVAHLFGGLADMDRLLEVSRENGLLVIDDAAQAAGLKVKDNYAGTLGNAGIISFGMFKPLAGTGGGAFLTNDDRLYEAAKGHLGWKSANRHPASVLVRHGIKFGLRSYSYLPFLVSRCIRSNWRSNPLEPGGLDPTVYEMAAVHRGLARERTFWIRDGWEQLRPDAERFRRAVESAPCLENALPRPYVGFPRWAVRLSNGRGAIDYRRLFQSFLSRGVEVHAGYVPLSKILKKAGIEPVGEFSKAEAVSRRVMLLPFYRGLNTGFLSELL